MKINRKGEVYLTNYCGNLTIIEYFNSRNVSVLFEDGTILKNIHYIAIKKGNVKNPNFPTVYKIDYIGIGKYTLSNNTTIEDAWINMLKRCYSENSLIARPTYRGCSVDERWHNFQVFAEWFYENYNPEKMKGWNLDKDIIKKNSKIYSPETCCFVPPEINMLFVNRLARRGKLPIGVSKSGNKYRAYVRKGDNYAVHLGVFNTPEEAFYAYKTAKEEYIKEVADRHKYLISEACYQAMYNYKIEIND